MANKAQAASRSWESTSQTLKKLTWVNVPSTKWGLCEAIIDLNASMSQRQGWKTVNGTTCVDECFCLRNPTCEKLSFAPESTFLTLVCTLPRSPAVPLTPCPVKLDHRVTLCEHQACASQRSSQKHGSEIIQPDLVSWTKRCTCCLTQQPAEGQDPMAQGGREGGNESRK